MEKEYRLRNKRDFSIVYRYGQSVANQQLVLYHLKQKKNEHFRLGISCSKKIGKAVVRNRMRRLLKEIIRRNRTLIPVGIDLIFIVRKAAVDFDYQQLEKSVLHVLRRAKLGSS